MYALQTKQSLGIILEEATEVSASLPPPPLLETTLYHGENALKPLPFQKRNIQAYKVRWTDELT